MVRRSERSIERNVSVPEDVGWADLMEEMADAALVEERPAM